MNRNKICFIMYVEDERVCAENILYLQNLIVPEGMEVECLTVNCEEGYAAAYQEGMLQSDAKYKVYYDENVFILNPDFIVDILSIFNSDVAIGAIGISGYKSMPGEEEGYRTEHDRYGALIKDTVNDHVEVCRYQDVMTEYEEVELIDDTLIVTAQDIPWQLDGCNEKQSYGWKQSIEFRKRGYRVVVSHQEKPWCLVDNYNEKGNK